MGANNIPRKGWKGNPLANEGWRAVGLTDDFDGVKWWVCIEELREPDDEWRRVKVAANGRALNKANYWTAWNGERLSATRDVGIMIEKRPGLFEAAEDVLYAAMVYL